MKIRIVYFYILVFSIGIFSCEKEKFVTDHNAILQFSHDTVLFDTIFSTIGSVTKQLRIYNKYNKSIKISSIYLSNADESNFRLNIDGYASTTAENIELAPKDSMLIFIEITIDPVNQDLPFLIQDSIIFITNGNNQYITLLAWGQDAFIKQGETIDSEVWTNNKPYLIFDSLIVPTGETLVIEAGTKIYFNFDAYMHINGTLIAEGEVANPILFCSDRLEDLYGDIPGQWQGIFLKGTEEHTINNAIIKNAVNGLWVGDANEGLQSRLRLTNSIIQNMSATGLYAQNAEILIGNCLITNCYNHALSLTFGGSYDIFHCTISNYHNSTSVFSSAVILSNYFIDNQNELHENDIEAYFGNSIIYGVSINEIDLHNEYNETLVNATFNYQFENCILKISETFDTSDTTYFKNIIKNVSPNFISIDDGDFRLDSSSVAIDNGNTEIMNTHTFLEYDILGTSRTILLPPDLGAYEKDE